jgi:hypothetical protein
MAHVIYDLHATIEGLKRGEELLNGLDRIGDVLKESGQSDKEDQAFTEEIQRRRATITASIDTLEWLVRQLPEPFG